MSAGIYIRWSTDDQGTGTTLEEQREACLRWAAEKGAGVLSENIFVDDGVSGAKESRPALNRLNRAIHDGAIKIVIVYKLDRLARSPYLAYKLVEKDWHNKASLVSVTEAHIDTTTTVGQLGFGIAAVFASHERNTTRDRTMSGKRRRAAEGRNPGLRPAYGYEIVDRNFVIVEAEAAIVRRIYDDYLTGRTSGHIARSLNDAGIRTRACGPWHISSVQRVLQNPAYMGRLVYRDITVDGAFPVIVERSTWEQAQCIRRTKAKIHPRRLASESPYILSGRLFCSQCGRPMNGRVCRNGQYENRYYACTGYIQFRDCDCLTVRKEQLEEAVVSNLLPLLNEEELRRWINKRLGTKLHSLRHEVSTLQDRLREIDRELTNVRQDYRRAKLNADIFNELRAEMEADKATLSERLTVKQSDLITAQADASSGKDAREAVSLLRVWEGLSYTQRRQLIHLLTERILWDYRSQHLTVQTAV